MQIHAGKAMWKPSPAIFPFAEAGLPEPFPLSQSFTLANQVDGPAWSGLLQVLDMTCMEQDISNLLVVRPRLSYLSRSGARLYLSHEWAASWASCSSSRARTSVVSFSWCNPDRQSPDTTYTASVGQV